jgi:hypothetical protein
LVGGRHRYDGRVTNAAIAAIPERIWKLLTDADE